jgi:hypothetical protein
MALAMDHPAVARTCLVSNQALVVLVTLYVQPEMRFGRWEKTLANELVDCIVTDPPYSERTHSAGVDRNDASDAEGSTPTYSFWTPDDVHGFVRSWSPRTMGWMVALTDSVLARHWEDAYRAEGRYAFAPIPCVIRAMSVRLQGDGPSSWSVLAMVGRPKTLKFAKWGTLDGAYVGNRTTDASSGRGKPSWLMEALVGDYSKPGDLVCDPCAGWGTTGTACLRLGRRFIGSEMDKDAYDESRRRMQGEVRPVSYQPSLL